MLQIVDWLEKLGLAQYAEAFAENDINVGVLPDLTDQDLKDLGVLLGHRRKILRAIAELTGAAPAAAAEPKPKDTGERRQLTVMFCDLVGSTALAAKLDPEDLREIIAEYRDGVAAIVRKYGGSISRYIGDGMLILFGHPSAHEDDAERAVRAALEIAAAVHAPDALPELELRVRLGLATGLVIVGDLIGSEAAEAQAVVGKTPNLAAGLQALAEPDGVVIAEDTRRLIGGLFDYHDLGAVTLKGFAAPVRAWNGAEPLDQSAGVALVRSVAGNRILLSEVVDEIAERTDGVPLFVEELTKTVLETSPAGVARAVSATPPLGLAVPPTLHASLMARLDRIGPVAKEVAQVGAAIGREFSYDLLAATAQRGDSELGAALDRLIDAGLVFRRGEPPDANFLFKHALVQDAAYGALLRAQRRELHARIARVLEERLATGTAALPEILAHHCGNAGLIEKAISYWQDAGERSKARSAMAESIRQIGKALDLLSHLPYTLERQRIEIELQLALGGALIAARGHASEETGKAYARARYLSELLGEAPSLLKALWGEFVHHHVRAETALSHKAAQELLHLAERQNDRAAMVAGHRAMGDSLLHLGHFSPARTHLEQGLILYDPVQHHSLTLLFDENARMALLSFLSLTLAILGLPDRAKLRSSEALAEARGLSHPISLAFALSVACRLYFILREPRMVRQLAEELIALTTEQRFAFFLAMGTTYRGWALVETSDVATGVDELRRGIAGFQASGAEWILPIFLDQLASAHMKAGQVEEGLRKVCEALVLTEKSGVRWFEAELHRRRSEFLCARSRGAEVDAEECLHRAIAVARGQDAKLWEMRATINLARLYRDQGRRSEAQNLLAPVFGWLTDGPDCADMKQAKALLHELA